MTGRADTAALKRAQRGGPNVTPSPLEVMNARADARRARESLQVYGGNVEDSAADDRTVALAICLAADAICARLHSLELTVAHGR